MNKDILNTLRNIAESFPKKSEESKAIEKAIKALVYIDTQNVRQSFKEFINMLDRPLNGIELINLKLHGLEIPEVQRSHEVVALEGELDALVDKLNKLKQ